MHFYRVLRLYHTIILRLMAALRFLSRAACLGWLFCSAALGSEASPIPSVDQWAVERALYEEALAELDSGAGNRYREIRSALADYPLRIDLDFSTNLGLLHDMTPGDAKTFIARAQGTPLASRFLVAYLRHKAQDRRWRAFLGVLEEPPAMVELQCHYYRAQLATGEPAIAYGGAATLWDVGFSQDDACNPLFDRWMAAGGPDDALIWSRALKAFKAKNGHLIRYLKRFAGNALQRDLDELGAVYRRPSRIEEEHYQDTLRHGDIVAYGVFRLAQLSPSRAYKTMTALAERHRLTPEQSDLMRGSIVRHSLFAERAPAPAGWVDTQIERLRDDELTLIWLRKQIARGEWAAIQRGLSWLSSSAQGQDRWRYWDARSRDQLGLGSTEALWEALSQSRSFHGFLAADHLGAAYQLNARVPPALDRPQSPAIWLGVGRVHELLVLKQQRLAKEQWRHTLNQVSPTDRERLGDIAIEQNWFDLAIDAANSGAIWDRIDLRFPAVHWEEFQRIAALQQLDAYELIAIARRESGLYPLARSKVGARGLMQLMPSTARSMAVKQNTRYRGDASLYQPSTNILLGATYYRELMRRYELNRVKSLAAYNAGPSRVSRWSSGELPVDQWVDSLPFGETREYVQAVLAYAVIYRARSGVTGFLLSESERAASY